MMDGKAKCPECTDGYILGFGCPGFRPVSIKCEMCGGTGLVFRFTLEWRAIGLEMKKDRIARGKPLRVEAQERGMKPVELSEMERGLIEPVKRSLKSNG